MHFLALSTLISGNQTPIEVQNGTVPLWKALMCGYFRAILTWAWQDFYLLPPHSENGRFTSYRGQLAVYSDYSCI